MTLFDEPGDWDAEYRRCDVGDHWVPAHEMLGPDACTPCGTAVMTGGA